MTETTFWSRLRWRLYVVGIIFSLPVLCLQAGARELKLSNLKEWKEFFQSSWESFKKGRRLMGGE